MSVYKSFSKKIQSRLPHPIEDYCESLRLLVYHKNQKMLDESWGAPYIYYDLASLTKPIFTTSAFMQIFEQDKEILHMDAGEILGWDSYQGIQIQSLLTHRSGLKWWHPFFEDPDCKKNKKIGIKNWLQSQKPKLQARATYSDLDYIVLGFILETLLDDSLYEIWLRLQDRRTQNQIHFPACSSVRDEKSRNQYAPTYSHQYKKGWVQGVVNDGNAHFMGGISTHAGLFGRAEDVALWLKDLRASLLGNNGILSSRTMRYFAKRAMTKNCGDWAVGFMLPSANSSCGDHFSKTSLGHLGFTGTSFWWDYKKDIYIVVLSNRYIQHKRGEEFKNLRSMLHNCVMESLGV